MMMAAPIFVPIVRSFPRLIDAMPVAPDTQIVCGTKCPLKLPRLRLFKDASLPRRLQCPHYARRTGQADCYSRMTVFAVLRQLAMDVVAHFAVWMERQGAMAKDPSSSRMEREAYRLQ